MQKKLLLPLAIIPLGLLLRAMGKPKKEVKPLIKLSIWGDPGEVSEEDLHSIASTVTILIANRINDGQEEKNSEPSLPLGIEKSAVEEVIALLNSAK